MFISSLLLVGCADDFLEPVNRTDLVTSEQLEEAGANNPEIIRGTLNGIYTLMITPGAGGSNLEHTDFGHKANDIFGDMLSGDMALTTNTYNWYRSIADYQTTIDFTRTENLRCWSFYYNVVKSSNLVIETLGGNDFVPENEVNRHLMGQAKALRGFAYFYLAQYYAREYEPTAEILPIYTETGLPPQPKSTTADVYALIVDDLTQSIDLLDGFTRSAKYEIDATVANGLLGYTYAAMGDYANAKAVTDAVINAGAYPLTTAGQTAGTSTAGFNNVATPSWIWGYDITIDLGLDLVSWWGQIDLFTYSYAAAGDRKSIDSDLYASIPVGDVRRTQFTAGTGYMPVNKFYHPARVQMGQRNIETDYIYMRMDEIYLLNAEAAAKTGDEATAKLRLVALLTNRLTGGATAANNFVNPLSGQALVDEIYHQTRVELWGEGKSYLAMKRNRATVTRGSNHLFQGGTSVPYNDERLTFKIPQRELLYNPNITGQN